MALIRCPECSKDISTAAEVCPNCGYVLVKNELPKIRRTELSEPKKNIAVGVLFLLLGIVSTISGLLTIAAIVGIFGIVFGIGMIIVGWRFMSGMQNGSCPYCGHSITVSVSESTHKCRHCNKTSTHKGDILEAIE